MRMNNMMKEYLGNDYSNNHLRNFCLYWMKGRESLPKYKNTEEWKTLFDEWRRKNDLDCLYFGGNLRADTLMSAWSPIKWVADCLNKEYGMKFYKTTNEDPNRYLKLLAEDRDAYLPPKHELVQLLDRFLELAEHRCNYILLPDRDMNAARYNCPVNGKTVNLYDEVPAMLYHLFDQDWFGKYFVKNNAECGEEHDLRMDADKWIKRECLVCGFKGGMIDQEHVIPFLNNLPAGEAKWLTEEAEIKEALTYMINLLEKRQEDMEKNPYIMLVTREEAHPDNNMHYYNELKYGEALMEDGTIIPIFTKTEYEEIRQYFGINDLDCSSGSYLMYTYAYVREDYKDTFLGKRGKGKTYFSILKEMAKEKMN